LLLATSGGREQKYPSEENRKKLEGSRMHMNPFIFRKFLSNSTSSEQNFVEAYSHRVADGIKSRKENGSTVVWNPALSV
jgi:hypothetical protein